jgi:predicted esterase
MNYKLIIALVILFKSNVLFIRSQEVLKLEEIMKGYDFVGNLPENHRWGIDGKTVYFEWNPTNEVGKSTYYVLPETKKIEKLKPEDEFKSVAFDERQANRSEVFFIWKGILYSYSKNTKKYTLRLHSAQRIYNLQILSNPDFIAFEQAGNLFLMDIKLNSLLQITNFIPGNKPPEVTNQSFLEQQQLELFEYMKAKKRESDWYSEKAKRNVVHFPKPIYKGSSSFENIQIDPTGTFVVFRASDYPAVKSTQVENFITASGYTNQSEAREKVSIHALSSHKLGVLNRNLDSVFFIDFSTLSHFADIPTYLTETAKKNYPKERKIVMNEIVWNKSGSQAVCDIRSLDNKDRWIVSIDFSTGKIFEINYQHDEAWIGGPGIGEWDFETGTLGFLPTGSTIYFQSEISGYSHLYTYDIASKKMEQITSGKWEVREVKLNTTGTDFFLTSTETHPGNRSFYKVSIATKKRTPLFTKSGAYEVILAPNEKDAIIRYSYRNKPWELYAANLDKPEVLTQLTFSLSTAFNKYAWKDPEIVSFSARDGKAVYARLYEPPTAKKNGAAIIFVHGAGYLQNAHNYWSSYHREYMFHNLLTDLGYTVLDIDYRASDGYGRDFRTGIYRHMGGLDLTDQLDGKQVLIDKYGIDSSRVGIYGGSYGGFITLMAMLSTPGEFACGAALRSVTDWAHYNQGYTSNILNFPETDSLAYVRSSPIYFADGLQGNLVMLHGMVDDNVQFQDVVRLSQRFIELGKKGWDLAIFPVEAHGFKETYSWIDEYRRILDLMNKHLLKND